MGQQDPQMDVESLQKTGSQPGRCLLTFLLVSTVFLFLALGAVTAGGVILVRELRSRLDHGLDAAEVQDLRASASSGGISPTYKMQNFAYVRADENKLRNCSMKLRAISYGEGTSVGSNYVFSDIQHSLQPRKQGTYFIYIELNFTCTGFCDAGVVSVSVGEKLTCEVTLPHISEPSETPVSRRCWTVAQMDQDKLLAQMKIDDKLKNWQLELKGSGLGVFLVD